MIFWGMLACTKRDERNGVLYLGDKMAELLQEVSEAFSSTCILKYPSEKKPFLNFYYHRIVYSADRRAIKPDKIKNVCYSGPTTIFPSLGAHAVREFEFDNRLQ